MTKRQKKWWDWTWPDKYCILNEIVLKNRALFVKNVIRIINEKISFAKIPRDSQGNSKQIYYHLRLGTKENWEKHQPKGVKREENRWKTPLSLTHPTCKKLSNGEPNKATHRARQIQGEEEKTHGFVMFGDLWV